MEVKIEESWRRHIGAEFDKQYFADLVAFVRSEYMHHTCYPPGKLIFNAFNLCPFDSVKVVIIGQDPYHEPGQAHGLSFSVNDGVPFPPSLVNIFKEIQLDLGTPMPTSGNLTRWAGQGVLLLNATLTVRAHQAASHQPPAQGLGGVYRRRHQGAQRRPRPPGVHPVGRLRALEGRAHRPVAPPRAAVGAPLAALGQPRGMVRQPPFFARQRLPRGPRHGAHTVVTPGRGASAAFFGGLFCGLALLCYLCKALCAAPWRGRTGMPGNHALPYGKYAPGAGIDACRHAGGPQHI